ncbi:MAG: hypothetical protein GX261_04500 [Spirochaetales bacterium]|nr:hypothetical protein [Spirochaetales bacterium]
MSSKQEETKKVGKAQVIILSTFAVIVVALSVFGCYGCSYHPVSPPTPEEALSIVERIRETVWELDEAGEVKTIGELGGKLKTIEILSSGVEGVSLDVLLEFENSMPKEGKLLFLEDSGFSLSESGIPLNVTIVFSNSKDGNSETLTLKGNESNSYLYYLKI